MHFDQELNEIQRSWRSKTDAEFTRFEQYTKTKEWSDLSDGQKSQRLGNFEAEIHRLYTQLGKEVDHLSTKVFT
jgi:hypothetical protein